MHVVIIGSGGREHCLFSCVCRSQHVSKVTCVPGNIGTETAPSGSTCVCANKSLDTNSDDFFQFCKNENVDLVVVGPEKPLAEGIADRLHEHGINCFGPTKETSLLESSKSYAKSFFIRHNIPTAEYAVFGTQAHTGTHTDTHITDAHNYVKNVKFKCVVKADGLLAGKGVIVADNTQEALDAIDKCLKYKEFGEAGSKIVIEERLEGFEVSIFCVTDGTDFVILPSAQDHKRLCDGDVGPNTGGMGAFAPSHKITTSLLDEIKTKIVKPTMEGMKKDKLKYNGVIFAGLMVTASGPKVLEYNVRFGDPETQCVLPLLQTDVFDLLYKTACGKLSEINLQVRPDTHAVTIVCASHGYPQKFQIEKKISGYEKLAHKKDVHVYFAGVKKNNDAVVTNGGRVLAVTGVAATLKEARELAYKSVDEITFEGKTYRRDIAKS